MENRQSKAKQPAHFLIPALLAAIAALFPAPAKALDPLCVPSANLGIPLCPESSTDWFESYQIHIATTDLVLGGIADINGIKQGLDFTSATFNGDTTFTGPLISGATPALSLDCDGLEGVVGHKVSSGLWTGGSCSSLPTGDAVRAATQTFTGQNTFDGEVTFTSTVSFTGFVDAVPSGAVMIFKSTPCPQGYSFDASFDARFPIGFDSPTPSHPQVPDFPNVNGGSDSHNHTGSVAVSPNDQTCDTAGPAACSTANHVHGTTIDSTTEYPRFLTVAFCIKD